MEKIDTIGADQYDCYSRCGFVVKEMSGEL
jgi:hypothetical protein